MNQKYVGEYRDRREGTAQTVTQKQKRRPHLENPKISLTEVQERRKRKTDLINQVETYISPGQEKPLGDFELG